MQKRNVFRESLSADWFRESYTPVVAVDLHTGAHIEVWREKNPESLKEYGERYFVEVEHPSLGSGLLGACQDEEGNALQSQMKRFRLVIQPCDIRQFAWMFNEMAACTKQYPLPREEQK